jgi:DNA-binding NtrC family response regulator
MKNSTIKTKTQLIGTGSQSHDGHSPNMSPQKNRGLDRRILVVDDDPHVLNMHTRVLSGLDCEVDIAEDGIFAWESMQRKNYDLLITDHQMSRLDGIGLMKKLYSVRSKLPVVMASDSIPTKELNLQPWLRVEAFILIPYAAGELLSIVGNIFSKSHDHAQSNKFIASRVNEEVSV